MASVNKVILIGNLTRDPELRYTAGQRPVTDLGLAINRYVGGGEEGERKEETLFIDVTVWDRQAENCCQYLAKGRPVYVEGYLRMDTWDDKNTGEKRSKIKVTAQLVQFLGGRNENGAPRSDDAPASRANYDRGPAAPRAAAPRPAPAATAAPAESQEEDIPF